MKLLGIGKRVRASTLIDGIYASRGVPYSEMERLIALAQKDQKARAEVLESLHDLLADGGDEAGIAWLVLVAGELGREGALTVLPAVHFDEGGDEMGEILSEAVGAALTRRADEILHELLREVHVSERPEARAILYEALDGAVVNPDEATRARLRLFALERFEIEKREKPPGLLHEPLPLLHYAGGEGVLAKVKEARTLCERGGRLDCDLNDVEALANGEVDFLERTRGLLAWSWRDVAENLERTFLG